MPTSRTECDMPNSPPSLACNMSASAAARASSIELCLVVLEPSLSMWHMLWHGNLGL